MKNEFKFMATIMACIMCVLFVQAAVPLQEVTEVPPELPAFWEFAVAFFFATFGGILLTSINHITAGTFSWKWFWHDSTKPLVFAFVAGLAISAVQIFLPSKAFLIEYVTGQEATLDYSVLMATGATLAMFVKGLFKIGDTRKAAK